MAALVMLYIHVSDNNVIKW